MSLILKSSPAIVLHWSAPFQNEPYPSALLHCLLDNLQIL